MAGLYRESEADGGGWRVTWWNAAGKRQSVRLGSMKQRAAETVRANIEALIGAKGAGTLDADTREWLEAIDDRLHAKLVRVGLTEPRDPTLDALVKNFLESIEVKTGTRVNYEQVTDSLIAAWGGSRKISTIGPLDAEKWVKSMRDAGLAEATRSKRIKVARQVFRAGVRWRMLAVNPFDGIRAGSQTNRDRQHFVSLDDYEKLLAACPDAEWRVLIALSRIGGLRCPSEHLALRWSDVDWHAGCITVRAAKTARDERGGVRVLPLFPELRTVLMESFEQAEPGSEYVITRYRAANTNLRTRFTRIIELAKLKPWPRRFHALRASRQTELSERFSMRAVCDWLGNSPNVAHAHYAMTLDAHRERAITEPTRPVPNPVPHHTESVRTTPTGEPSSPENEPETDTLALCGPVRNEPITPAGIEPAPQP